MKKRFALLLGAVGAGTTSVFRRLGAHPQVLPCRVKEPNFFSDDRKWALGVDWYRSLWDFREPDERIALEASVDYAQEPRVPCPAERIARMPAGFRFVYLLRHPIERIESQHARDRDGGFAEGRLSDGALERHLALSRYAMQLAPYREHFPREDFLLLPYEGLRSDPDGLLRRICRFLEIDPYFAFPEGRTPPAAEEPRPVGRPRWPRLRRWLRGRPPPARRRFRLEPGERERVREALADDLARLVRDWGFDVSGWDLDAAGPQPQDPPRR